MAARSLSLALFLAAVLGAVRAHDEASRAKEILSAAISPVRCLACLVLVVLQPKAAGEQYTGLASSRHALSSALGLAAAV
jgi:hypothetical protein